MEEVLNGCVTNPNPTPTLTPNPNRNSNPNRINNKNPKRNDFRKSIGRFVGWNIVLTHGQNDVLSGRVYSRGYDIRIYVPDNCKAAGVTANIWIPERISKGIIRDIINLQYGGRKKNFQEMTIN